MNKLGKIKILLHAFLLMRRNDCTIEVLHTNVGTIYITRNKFIVFSIESIEIGVDDIVHAAVIAIL